MACDVYTSPEGVDSPSCGGIGSPCRTIQQGVTNTPAGGSLCITKATYINSTPTGVMVDRSIRIYGNNSTIDGQNRTRGGFQVATTNPNDTVLIDSVTIVNGYYPEGSGALHVGGEGMVTLSNSKFINNFATTGGAIWVMQTVAGVTISHCEFVGNRASYQGGALHLETVPSAVVVRSSFIGNSAFRGGGVFVFQGQGHHSAVRVVGSCFQNNFAGGNFGGGGLGCFGTGSLAIDIEDTHFEYNVAMNQGAGAAFLTTSPVTIRGSFFQTNEAMNRGGGLYIESCHHVTLHNNTILHNKAGTIGGGQFVLYWEGGGVNTDGCMFYSHNNIYQNNTAPTGGGSSIFFGGNTLNTDYTNTNLTVTDDTYTNNSATGEGGGLWLGNPIITGGYPSNNNNMASLWRVSFLSNTANQSGGGMYVLEGTTQLFDCSFVDNWAWYQGGAIQVSSMGGAVANITIDGGEFTNNNATDGYDLYMDSEGSVSIGSSAEFHVFPSPTGKFLAIPKSSSVDLNSTRLVCPAGWLIDWQSISWHTAFGGYPFTLAQIGCIPCGQGYYSLHGSRFEYGTLTQYNCTPCPSFADCRQGAANVIAYPNHWCSNFSDEVRCFNCPLGYCVENSASEWNATCVDGREGILCGGCKEGYGSAFGTNNCVEDSQCDAAGWFFPLLFLWGFCFIVLMLVVPVRRHPLWKSSTYFLQIVPLIVSLNHNATMGIILAVFSLDPSILGIHVRVCLWPGMTSLQKMASDYLIPVILVCELPIIYLLHRFCRFLYRKLFNTNNDDLPVSIVQPPEEEEAEEEEEEIEEEHSSHHQDYQLLNDNQTKEKENDSLIARYAAAFLALLLLMYQGVTGATMNFLTCAKVQDEYVLFRSGVTPCYQSWWYALLVILLVLLAPVPFFLIVLRRVLRKREYFHPWAHAVLQVLEGPYALNRRMWESVGLLRRLCLLCIASFVLDPLWRAVGLFIGCSIALMIHLFARPFKESHFDHMEALFLYCLALIAALQIPLADHYSVGKLFEGSSADGIFYTQMALTILPVAYGILLVFYVAFKHRILRWVYAWLSVMGFSMNDSRYTPGELSTHMEFVNVEKDD